MRGGGTQGLLRRGAARRGRSTRARYAGIVELRADRAGRHRALRHAARRARSRAGASTASACRSSRRTSAPGATRRRHGRRRAVGPARARAPGAVRDFVLGATLLNGRGELLRFGGQVMKNVAGYDVSRLLAGSLGTLGADRRGVAEGAAAAARPKRRCGFEMTQARRARSHERLGRPAAADLGQRVARRRLCVRLSGAEPAVARRGAAKLGGEPIERRGGRILARRARAARRVLRRAASRCGASRCLRAAPPLGAARRHADRMGRRTALAVAPRDARGARARARPAATRRCFARATSGERVHAARRRRAAPTPRAEGGFRSGRHPQSRPPVRRSSRPRARFFFCISTAARACEANGLSG